MSAWMGITNLLPSFFCIILQLLLDICMAHDLMPNLGHNAPYCVCVVHSCYVNDSMHACDSIFGSQVQFRLWVVLFHKSVCIIFRLLNMHVYTWHCECDHALFFSFFFSSVALFIFHLALWMWPFTFSFSFLFFFFFFSLHCLSFIHSTDTCLFLICFHWQVAPHQEKNESNDTGSLYDLEPSDDGAFRMGKSFLPPSDFGVKKERKKQLITKNVILF